MARKRKPKYATHDDLPKDARRRYKHWNHPDDDNSLRTRAWSREYNRTGQEWGWSQGCHEMHVEDLLTAGVSGDKKDQARMALVALAEWAHCMYKWGQDVRLHIENLKAEVNLEGDPGDPPPPPWGK